MFIEDVIKLQNCRIYTKKVASENYIFILFTLFLFYLQDTSVACTSKTVAFIDNNDDEINPSNVQPTKKNDSNDEIRKSHETNEVILENPPHPE